MDSTPKQNGAALIAAFVSNLSAQPGVYRMLDEKGEALYVGKAKSLKSRVAAYTKPEKNSVRIQRMIALTATMEFTVTHTEAEALLLEANLIKKLKPRYNILLRDDKSFPSILVTADHDFPQVLKHRGSKDRTGEYFGPFASGYAVHETLDVLHKAFALRNCSDSIFASRTRPCLQYQIRRCTAPCVGKVTAEEYAKQVDMARRFLSGKSRGIQEDFAERMQQASDALDYETAAAWRDRIKALTQVQSRQTIQMEGLQDADVFALHREGNTSCVQVFFFRGGGNFGNRPYFPRHDTEDDNGHILAAFIAQFYTTRPVPKDIILSHQIPDKTVIAEALALRAGYKVALNVPERGDRKSLVKMALNNAKDALARKAAAEAGAAESLGRLAETFGLEESPERVEVYDNSHIQGSHALGTLIVTGTEGFRKSAYRKFNIRDKPGDDTAMMREVFTRRFKNADGGEMPDFILIDGGQGQLNAALETLADLGVSGIPIAAIAKGPDRNAGRERFFTKDKPPFSLPQNDPLLHFLQRIRDEAHRFAITSHRARRAKALVQSPLDTVPGIGGKRKKALLLHFGSAKAVAEAGVADLQSVTGISKAVAEKIYGHFHEDA